MDTSWGWGEALLGKSPGGVLYFTSLVLAEDCKMLASMGSNWQCNLKKKKKKDYNISNSPPFSKKSAFKS